jgi:membrane-associated protease RseP (regulator of RpoE activity)
MKAPKFNRPWTIATLAAVGGALCLALGMFLAIARDSKASDDVKVYSSDGGNVKVIRVRGNGEGDETAAKAGFLGVDVDEETKSSEGGALVRTVVDDSPASKAGLKEGDVIVGFDGDVVRGPAKLTEKIHATKPGDKVTLDVRRDGKIQKMSVEMGGRPNWSWSWRGGDSSPMTEEQERALEDSMKSLEKNNLELEKLGKMKINIPGMHRLMVFGGEKPLLGVELVETTEELRQVMGGRKDAGVLIGKVMADSAAEKAGLKVGDLVLSVDGDAVADPGDLASAVREHQGKTVDLEVSRDKKTIHLKAQIPEVKDEEPSGPSARLWRFPAAAPAAPPAPPAYAVPVPAMAPRVPRAPRAVPPPEPPDPPPPPCAAAELV